MVICDVSLFYPLAMQNDDTTENPSCVRHQVKDQPFTQIKLLKPFPSRPSRSVGRSDFGRNMILKLSQNSVIHLLLGAAMLTAIVLLYFILAPLGGNGHSMAMWILFGAAALLLSIAAFGPSIYRARRGLPTAPPMSPSEIRTLSVIAVIGCVLAFFGMTVGIILAPLYFIFRQVRSGS